MIPGPVVRGDGVLGSSDRALRLWLALAGISACGQRSLTPADDLGVATGADLRAAGDDLLATGNDLFAAGDLAPPALDGGGGNPDLGGFCGNPNSPRIQLNAMLAASPSVSASPLILDCCDAAEIDVISMQISTAISVVWRHNVGQGPNLPVTLDLAHLPPGWTVSVLSGCGFAQPNCHPTLTGFGGARHRSP